MMAARAGILPSRLLATGDPLPRQPPARHFLGLAWVLDVDDHDHVAVPALDLRRDIGVLAVVVEAMHAATCRFKKRDLLRLCFVRDIEDLHAATEFRIEAAEFLIVD